MSVAALSPTRQFAVPVSLDNQQQSGKANRGGALAALGNSTPASDSDQVSISSQALDELTKDADILGKLTRQSLSSLTPNAASAQITFDHLTYSKSSNVSLQQSGNSGSFHSDQQQSISGTGHIKTADGREFEFSAELDVSQSLDISQSGPGGFDLADLAAQALGAAQNGAKVDNLPRNTGIVPPQDKPIPGNTGIVPPQDKPSAADNYVKLTLPKLQDLVAAGEHLLNLLDQLNPGNGKDGAKALPAGNSDLAAGKQAAIANNNGAKLLQLLNAQKLNQVPENTLLQAA